MQLQANTGNPTFKLSRHAECLCAYTSGSHVQVSNSQINNLLARAFVEGLGLGHDFLRVLYQRIERSLWSSLSKACSSKIFTCSGEEPVGAAVLHPAAGPGWRAHGPALHQQGRQHRGLLGKDRNSVPDPWHFGVDPDPRIHAADKWIRILLFSLLTFKAPTKTNLKKKFFCLLLFYGTSTSFFKDKMSKRSHKTVGIKVFLTIFS